MYKSLIRGFCTATSKKPSLVILGTGWGGYRLLEKIDAQKYDVHVVSPRNHFIYTPLLAGTAVGTLEFRSVAESIHSFHKPLRYYEAYGDKIDLEGKKLHCKNAVFKDEIEKEIDFTLPFDKLVISCGAVTNTFGTPGVPEHAFFLKELGDAKKIRNRILDLHELAAEPALTEQQRKDILHLAIVGGGPTGVELSAEIHDFIKDDVCRLYPHLKGLTKITIYDVAPKILSNFDKKLADYAVKKFARDGTEIKTKIKIKEIQKTKIIFEDGTEVPTGMVVWSTGLSPNDFVKSLPFSKDKAKRLLTDETLHILKEDGQVCDSIFAIGDCANVKDTNLPQTAQVAEQKAYYLAKLLNEGDPKGAAPFKYHHKGAMAYIGDWKGLFDSDVKGSGRMAWLIWRSAYYSMISMGRNKILVPTYWFITWAFGRDTTRF